MTGVSLLRTLPVARFLTGTNATFALIDDRQPSPSDVIDTARKLADAVSLSSSIMSDELAANSVCVFAFAGLDKLLR